MPDGTVEHAASEAPRLAELRARLLSLAQEDARLVVEDKGSSLALHFRLAPERERELRAVVSGAAELHEGHHVLHGKMVVEVRPARSDKGDAVARFMETPPFAGRTPVFAGDDSTDEAGFATVNRLGGISVKVGAGRERRRLPDLARRRAARLAGRHRGRSHGRLIRRCAVSNAGTSRCTLDELAPGPITVALAGGERCRMNNDEQQGQGSPMTTSESPATCRIGFDIGGTFTDFILADEATGRLHLHKCLTTPEDPSIGALEGMTDLLRAAGVDLAEVGQVVHGTTLVTNSIIERTGARLGLLTTRGFRDILEMGTEQRYDIHDLFLTFPKPLAARRDRREITERVSRDGAVLEAIDREAVRREISDLVDDGVEALAVCFLHAYKNPVHERLVRDLVRTEFPDLPVSVSSDVHPQINEYERSSTTAANAYVQPLMSAYVRRLDRVLRERGFRGRFHLIQSSGGLTAPETAERLPIRFLESGPAGGRAGERAHRPRDRSRRPPLLRHGRDDGQGVSHPERRAGHRVHAGDGARSPLQEGERPPGPRAGDRHDGDRRGRRLDRPGGRARPAQGRP